MKKKIIKIALLFTFISIGVILPLVDSVSLGCGCGDLYDFEGKGEIKKIWFRVVMVNDSPEVSRYMLIHEGKNYLIIDDENHDLYDGDIVYFQAQKSSEGNAIDLEELEVL